MPSHAVIARTVVSLLVVAAVLSGAAALTAVTAPPAAAATVAGTFTPVPPARVLDTRTSTAVPGGGVVTVQVAGRAGVPQPIDFRGSVVLTVTATRSATAGHVSVSPSSFVASYTSDLNFNAGQTVANTVTTEVGDNGNVSLHNGSSGPVHLVVDVMGWHRGTFRDTGGAGGSYTSVTAERFLDTRTSGAQVPGGGTVDVRITNRQAIPLERVGAVAVNITATRSRAPGHVTAYAADSERPTTSNLNFAAGQTVAVSAVVPVSAGGFVRLHNGSAQGVDLLVDVVGWYTAGPASDPGAFSAVAPSRLQDTRTGPAVPGRGSTVLRVTGVGGVPSTGAGAVVLTVTATRARSAGHVTAHAAGTPMPASSNLNFRAGETVANRVIVPVGADGEVVLANGSLSPVHLVVDVSGWFREHPTVDVAADRVSVSTSGVQGGESGDPLDVSPDGRFVLFEARASTWDPRLTLEDRPALWRRDRLTGTTSLVTVPLTLGVPNEEVHDASISDDGRLVAFRSVATNFVPDDTNKKHDLFVVDLVAGTTVRLLASTGDQLAEHVWSPQISGDGRYVSFATRSDPDGGPRITHDRAYRWDLTTGLVTAVSPGGTWVRHTSISADGRYVAFDSPDQLLASDLDGLDDVYVRDLETNTLHHASERATASASAPQLSAAGDVVAWFSDRVEVIDWADPAARVQRAPGLEGVEHQQVNGWSLAPDGACVGITHTGWSVGTGGNPAIYSDRSSGDIWHVGAPTLTELYPDTAAGSVPVPAAGCDQFAVRSASPDLVEGDTNHHFDVFVLSSLGRR